MNRSAPRSIQGYFFSKPLPYPQLTEMLAQARGAAARHDLRPHDVTFWP